MNCGILRQITSKMPENILQIASVWLIPVLVAITFHEAAHGFVARKFGDGTAFMLGRVTLNPLKHIDPIGTLIVPGLLVIIGGFIFGWAKPVPVTLENLRHPRKDMALVAVAGPLSNLLMALFWGIVIKLGYVIGDDAQTFALVCIYVGGAGVFINFVLLILNLLPIPPLDGSRVVTAFLPGPMAYRYNQVEPYGIFIILGLMFLGVLSQILFPTIEVLLHFTAQVLGIPRIIVPIS